MIHRRYSLGLRLSYLLELLAHDATEIEALTDHREPLSRNRALSPITCVVSSDIIRNDILLSRCRYCWLRSKTQEDRSLPTLVNICPDTHSGHASRRRRRFYHDNPSLSARRRS